MTYRRMIACCVTATTLSVAAAAADKGIHLTSGGETRWNWMINDGAGFRWDISSSGLVNDGTNDAYDGGMRLQVNGSAFSWNRSGKRSADGREVEIGPWPRGAIRVYRRIYVDAKIGYCRWIDIFENPSTAAQTLTLRYHTNVGGATQLVHTTSGAAEPSDKDWGVVTGDSGSSRPALVHIFATRRAKTRPRLETRRNNDDLYYHMKLTVPAKKTVAVCLIEAQRRPFNTAKKFLKEFPLERELQKIPAPLRRILVNMGGMVLQIGSLELPRHEKHDLAVLRNGDELLGVIENQSFQIETFYGRLELPAATVIGLSAPSPADPHVQVALADGQIVAGKFLNAPLRLKLAGGDVMSLPTTRLKTAAFRLSANRPREIPLDQCVIVLRSGQQLFFRQSDLDVAFHSEYGQLALRADDLHAIHFDTAGGGLHRAEFRNGSILSGLFVADALSLTLDLGPTLKIPRHLALRVAMPAAAQRTDLPVAVTLRNNDVLYGRILDETLTMQTRDGTMTRRPKDVAELKFTPGLVGPAQMHLRNGTTVTGKFVGRTIDFQIVPGPKLSLFVGHIIRIDCTPGKAAPRPAPGGRNTPPRSVYTPAVEDRAGRLREARGRAAEMRVRARAEEQRLKVIRARLAALQAKLAAIEKRRAQLVAKGGAAAKEELRKVTASIDTLRKQIAKAKKRIGSP